MLKKSTKDEKAYRVLLGLLKIVESSQKWTVKRSFITHSDGEAPNKVFSLVNMPRIALVLPDDESVVDILDSIARNFEVANRMTNIFLELAFSL